MKNNDKERRAELLKIARGWAKNRGRVINAATNETGNLIEWGKGRTCKVFIRYEQVGTLKSPVFANWEKVETFRDEQAGKGGAN